MITIHHNPRCSTSRKALELLQAQGQPLEIVDYLKTPLTVDALRSLIEVAGLSVREAMRTKEPIYQQLGLDGADEAALLQAMAAHPVLLNRPFVTTPKGTRLCRPFERIHEIL
ncbi:arsenate reductase (glutaredoxin) [Castellaniella sp.]|uniref:arsenate reductase (glutaredoxin) n=1 Tax=Castellaniella sp. TaxID=1955812 RepID=UPI00355EB29D